MNITIVGAGNIGTQFATHCAEKQHSVTIYGSKPYLISKKLTIVDENQNVIHEGTIQNSTNDEKLAFKNADLIFVTVPAFCMREIAKRIVKYVKEGTKIGLVPGTGGGECAFKECIDKGCIVFGLQRVPSVARLVEYGTTVCATGYRDTLCVASLPHQYTAECCELISSIFDMPCTQLPNYLNLTLTPSNPILHTTRLRIIFKDYQEGKGYEYVPLFYEEWDDESSELLIRCDNEVQQICKALKEFDLTYVKSLLIHYESENAKQLTQKISSIKGFKGLKTPTIFVEGKYHPDLHSRYFTADFSYGMVILKQIADFVGVDIPYINQTLSWYKAVAKEKEEFVYENFGIYNLNDFRDFYSK